MQKDVVCSITIRLKNGVEKQAFLARRGDPVLTLDKLLGKSKIAPTDIVSMAVRPMDASALTVRAVESVSKIFESF